MNRNMKIASAVMAGAMALSLTACSSKPAVVATFDGKEVTAGVYLTFLTNVYASGSQQVEDTTKDVFEQQIEGKDAAEWMKEQALAALKEYAAIDKQFDELGLTLADADTQYIDQLTDQDWQSYGGYYEANNIAKESFRLVEENNYKASMIFNKYYGEGGLEAVPDEDIIKHMSENLAETKALVIPLTDSSGNALSDEKKAEYKTLAETYYKQVTEEGKTIDEIITEFNKVANEGSESSASSSSDASQDTSDSIANPNVMLIQKDNTQVPSKFKEKLFSAAADEVFLQTNDDDNYYFVAKKLDVTKDTSVLTQYRSTLLQEMKSDEYRAKIEKWSEEVELKVDEKAIAAYPPTDIKEPEAASSAASGTSSQTGSTTASE
ncbi:hypothetical protein [Candidatus Soleaferrea massiliensis]|uniref:hypothetical protein n=1 Tax=Candidatus Soleaferrea massiliensis TaxID=1470354 RepID=UPI00058C6AF6|nr:hypothetical protein [Candidatus Soleaferrea massiliensis]